VRIMWIPVLLVMLYTGWVLWQRHSSKAPPPPPTRDPLAKYGDQVKIVTFYSSAGTIARGGKALLCYAVLNANAVRLAENFIHRGCRSASSIGSSHGVARRVVIIRTAAPPSDRCARHGALEPNKPPASRVPAASRLRSSAPGHFPRCPPDLGHQSIESDSSRNADRDSGQG
jgi:hypothetical protein